MKRDISKTLSFLVLHLIVGFSVAYAFTGSIALASGIALIEPVVNAFVFFFHEKIWSQEAGAAGALQKRAAIRFGASSQQSLPFRS
ncbi:hypothetical protein A9995_01855 [Erythrobacter sp. QSSC1-22B]|uniref:DUF2061 domain-containing protein n=1 Tax=Erythrobacter sp. QSSC1-22B TaxID=1860125 RepID=UPI000805B959|nr:DUF2061 domain-containing protein [Erythrobacter sp. QSSC1-22B]OBX20483.1 hypothetical protein A9995_01855 [Erythrobacter sp. QSSC1-22B]